MLDFECYALLYRWACIQQRWPGLPEVLTGWRCWLLAAVACTTVAGLIAVLSDHAGFDPEVGYYVSIR